VEFLHAASWDADEAQQKTAQLLDAMNTDHAGYFFAADYAGTCIVGPSPGTDVYDVEDKNGFKVVQELIKAAKQGGGYVQYVMPPINGVEQVPKISYVLPYEPFGWYIGAGVNLDEIQPIIDGIKAENLRADIQTIVIGSSLIALLLLIFNLLNRRMYRKVEREVGRIKDYLEKSAVSKAELDTGSFQFAELEQIGRHTVGLIEKMDSKQQELSHQCRLLEEATAELEETNTSLTRIQSRNEYLIYHDQLTNAYNRRYFEESLARLDNPAHLPLVIAMFDVNGLKLTNDAFGHQTGDHLLCVVANLLQNHCVHPEGFVARIGGDEFVIVCPNACTDEIDRAAGNIYAAIQRERGQFPILSVSIGWAIKDSMDQKLSDVFQRAEEQMYHKKLTESQSMRHMTVQAIMKTLNEKNAREKIHSECVSIISSMIGEAMKLDYGTVREIETAGLLHDIGKISVDENILNKEGRLTNEEYEKVKKHPESSYQILKSIDAYAGMAEVVLSHHERWDGGGYPRNLKGEEIPLIARIISVADAFEAMTANRSYRAAMPKSEALAELKRCAGAQFDPRIVKIFEEKVVMQIEAR
jgi:diguanylate cyclase (GGDEF)-like protein